MKTLPRDIGGIALSILILFLTVLDLTSGLWVSTPYQLKQVGDSLVVVCKDINTGKAVTWRGPRDRPLGEKTHPTFYVRGYGTALAFTQIQNEDAGTYTCKSETGESEEFTLVVGDDSGTFDENTDDVDEVTEIITQSPNLIEPIHTISPQEPIEFTGTPSIQKGVEGENFTVACEAKRGIIEWSIDEEQPRPPKYAILGDGLLIVNLTREDGQKKYICRAVRESSGDVKEKEITLKVQHEPVWTPKYEKQDIIYGIMGSFVNLTCEVESEPPPSFQWLEKRGKRKIGKETLETPNKSVLQLKITKESFGHYTCIAKNDYGKLEVHYTLTNGTRPNQPTALELKSAGPDHLDLEIVGPGESEDVVDIMKPIGFYVEYKPENLSDYNWSGQEFEIAQDNAYTLTGLEQDTSYEIRAATRNLAGISEFTNTSIFQTEPNHGVTFSANLPCALTVTFSLIVFILSSGSA